jgi:hypothetical protein
VDESAHHALANAGGREIVEKKKTSSLMQRRCIREEVNRERGRRGEENRRTEARRGVWSQSVGTAEHGEESRLRFITTVNSLCHVSFYVSARV